MFQFENTQGAADQNLKTGMSNPIQSFESNTESSIQTKSILSASKIYPYVINPSVGCQHACSYCYARYMKKFTGHKEPWGTFVDVKINAAELLRKEICKKKKAPVWIRGVCDPYQPLERKYKLTRQCL